MTDDELVTLLREAANVLQGEAHDYRRRVYNETANCETAAWYDKLAKAVALAADRIGSP